MNVRSLKSVFCLLIPLIVGTISEAQVKNHILKIELRSPGNTAMHHLVQVTLQNPAAVYVEYEEVVTGKRFRTVTSPCGKNHKLHLLLLKANTEYVYRVHIVDKLLEQQSKELSFKTREQSPCLKNHWFNEKHPHDTTALGDGMILVCYGGIPGYIALIDKTGEIRWYWQVEDIGIRTASLTPRGTFLAMLYPDSRDIIKDASPTPGEVAKDEHKKIMKRRLRSRVGGTGIAEISLSGELLWRLDLNKTNLPKEFQVIHHEILMDEDHNIHTLYRPRKALEKSLFGILPQDTLIGDGILVLDSLGNVQKNWSAWDVWDVEKDKYLSRHKYDRFHMNGFDIDSEGNYLLSVPVEDQIWKISGETGNLIWKFGRDGDFQMDTASYFSFQHAPYLTEEGDLVLFDNGLCKQRSGTRVFRLNEQEKTASTVISAMLPPEKYSERQGSGYLMPNGNILQTSSRTNSILITTQQGEILWESIMPYGPYRAIYVPAKVWNAYFTPLN